MDLLSSTIIPVEQLSNRNIQDMYRLFANYYECTDVEAFHNDLSHKNAILQIYNDRQELAGFTTILHYPLNFEQQTLNIIYSGDTIMAQQYWGNPILAFSWLKYAGSIKAKQPDIPLYWFMIVKGHRTYRYLPVFSKIFYPSCEHVTPPWEKRLMDHLAKTTFGEYYDALNGIVHFPCSKGHLKQAWAHIPQNLLQRKEIQFFQNRNPGYHQGDELVCLCKLENDNLKPLAQRLFQEGYQEQHDKHLVV